MELRDSRRLTGPNLLLAKAGAVIDLEISSGDPAEQLSAAWCRHAQRMLEALGWASEELATRAFHGGLSLGFTAPSDALYAATEVNEWAWETALSEVESRQGSSEGDSFDANADRLRALILDESNPAIPQLAQASAERNAAFLTDDDFVSVGLGTGSQTWEAGRVPDSGDVDWSAIRDVPTAQITGTNGKTTTVRLLAEMVRAAGMVPGLSSTDWIGVGDEVLDYGDYAGPGGARQVLRDRRVEVAILETARGGMLRRGLALEHTDVAAITNVAADHLGEFGVHDLNALADCKFVVTRAARHLVLNADDPLVRARGLELHTPITWLSLDGTSHFMTSQPRTTSLVNGRIILQTPLAKWDLGPASDVPMTLAGAARYNVANALAACAVGFHLGLSQDAVREGLLAFESTPASNPGRLNDFNIGGARVLVDFAHNPHGVQALLETANALPAKRRLVTVGQAGDRDDTSLRELAAAIWTAEPDRILIKAMEAHLRGRVSGEVASILERDFLELGAHQNQLEHTGSEIETAKRALAWAEEGDLVVLIVHTDRTEVLDFLTNHQN